MTDQSIQLFGSPSALFTRLIVSETPSSSVLVIWALYIVFAFWTLYTLVAIYHWLKYSHASWVAFPAITAHLLISLALISYALSGSALFLTPYLP